MNPKTSLDSITMETAVLGGAVLGCGGGGKLEDGLYLGEIATTHSGARLKELIDLSDLSLFAMVMPVNTSGHDTQQIVPYQTHRAVEILQHELKITFSGIVNGGLGAVENMIGWELSGFFNVPLLDASVPIKRHPSSLRNMLAFFAGNSHEPDIYH